MLDEFGRFISVDTNREIGNMKNVRLKFIHHTNNHANHALSTSLSFSTSSSFNKGTYANLNTNNSASDSASSSKTKIGLALYNYVAQSDDELSFSAGIYITCMYS